MLRSIVGLAFVTVSALSGCSGEKKASAAQPAAVKEGSVAPRAAAVTALASPYRPITVVGGSRLTGTVDFDGVIPPDSVIRPTADQPGCGQTVTVRSIERTGARIGGVVVWLSDIRTGKPLPIERRFELVNEDCVLTPQVQAVHAPATLNFSSEDVAAHRHRIINVATGEVEGIAPFNDNGELVPFDRLLDKPEQLEIICDIHPWSNAWILAFDHPYYAVSSKAGAFDIGDVPPGRYRVKAWHPVLGGAEQTLTVVAGQPATIALRLGEPTKAGT